MIHQKRKVPFVIYDGGGVLQEVDQLGRDDFVSYTPINPPPYGGTLVASGQYFTPYNWNASQIFPVALRAYYVPLLIPYPMLIDELSINCTVAESGKKCKIGIFSVERGVVGKNIYVNVTGMGSVGQRLIPANISLGAGSYALFFMANASTAKIIRATIFTALLGRISVTSSFNQGVHWYQDLSSFDGDLNDDPTLIIEENSGLLTPQIMARMA